jgi:hypothetical protein
MPKAKANPPSRLAPPDKLSPACTRWAGKKLNDSLPGSFRPFKDDQYYKDTQVAETLGIHRMTVWLWSREPR